MRSGVLALAYGVETIRYAHQFREEVASLGLVGSSIPVSMVDVGSAVFGVAVFDMESCERPLDNSQQSEARYLGGISMKYLNCLDDDIDDPELALTMPKSSGKLAWKVYHQANGISIGP